MNINLFEVFVRRAPGVASRRSSLLVLGAAPLAAFLTGIPAAGARQGGKHGRRKKHRPRPLPTKPRPLPTRPCPPPVDYCGPLNAECHAFCPAYCDGAYDPEECELLLNDCCAHLETCDASSFFTCLRSALPNP